MTNSPQKRLIMDLWPTVHGHGGIPNECRLMFDLFTEIGAVDTTGYINWPHAKMLRYEGTAGNKTIDERLFMQSVFIRRTQYPQLGRVQDLFISEGAEPKLLRVLRVANRLRRAYQGFGAKLYPMESDIFSDFLWTEAFDKSLGSERRERVLERPFVYSNTSRSVAHVIAMNTGFHQGIDTRGYDFYFTFANFSWRLPRSTLPIVRYYDSIPITHPHFFDGTLPLDNHYKTVKYNAEDGRTIFVCDSDPVRDELVRLFPQLERRVLTIPCFITTDRSTQPSSLGVHQIVHARLSTRIARYQGPSLSKEAVAKAEAKRKAAPKEDFIGRVKSDPDEESASAKRKSDDFGGKKEGSAVPPIEDYVIAVSTLEPRKNYARLAQAWTIVKGRLPENKTRLIVVANLGWKWQATAAIMEPLIRQGHLIHLEKVETREMHRLYRDSIGVIAPSLVEGFDYSGIEGMHNGCPVLASDIAVHRSIYGDAPIYFDPYDVEAMAEALERLVLMSKEERRTLGEAGLRHSQKYRRDTVKLQWESFVDGLVRTQHDAKNGKRSS